MLKRLLIAVLALSFIMAFTGTAFSDVYQDNDIGTALPTVNTDAPKYGHDVNIAPVQPASRPEALNIRPFPPGFSIPAPPLDGFCTDLQYSSGNFYFDVACTGTATEDYFNVRYTADENYNCTLKVNWQYVEITSGTPDLMVYLWDDDGLGNPGTALDSIFYPSGTFGGGWLPVDFGSSPNAPAGGWVFSDGEDYHYGVRGIGTAADTLALVIDDASAALNRTTLWDTFAGPGAWGTFLGIYGADYMMFQSSQYCAGEIPFTDCYSQDYFVSFTSALTIPDPTYGNTDYSQRFDVSGPETLVSVDFYLYDFSDGAFGLDDININIYDDAAGFPSATVLWSTTLLAGSYTPGWNTIAVGQVFDNNFHVGFSGTGAIGTGYQVLVGDDGSNGQGRAFTSYDYGATWITMLSDWGTDKNLWVTANLCRDQFADCGSESHFSGIASFWEVGGLFRQAAGTRMTAAGQNCQVNEVGFDFYDPGLDFNVDLEYSHDTKISVYTDVAGLPGTELASIIIPGGNTNYSFFPATHYVDFHPLDVYVTGDYWIVCESMFEFDTLSGVSEGVYLLTDGGDAHSARSGIVYGAQHPNAGIWRTFLDRYGTDYGLLSYSNTCCVPYDDVPRACAPGSDAGWGTLQGNQARTGASDLSLADAWCNLNLNWAYEGPNGISFTGPVIYGDKAVCSFTNQYIVFNIITGAPLYTLNSGSGTTGFMIGTGISCSPTVANVGGTDIMYIGGGSSLGVGAIDFNTGAVLWENTLSNGLIFGNTAYTTFILLNDGVSDVLYHTTALGAVVALDALTGALYTGWGTNPVYLTGHPFISGSTDGVQTLYFATQDAATQGDVYSVDALTGAINWTLSGSGGLQANLEAGYNGYPEGFRGGVAYDYRNGGVLYASSWANDGIVNTAPIDGFFYSIVAADGSHFVPPTATNRADFSTPIVDENHVYVPTFGQWNTPQDPTGGNLIAFYKGTGIQSWGTTTPDDGRYYMSGLLTCEPDDVGLGLFAPDLLFAFNFNGFLECYNSVTGEQIFSRRVEHDGGAGEIGLAGALATTATDGVHMLYSDFYGGIYDLKQGADRSRLELQHYDIEYPVDFGTNPALSVNVGPIIVNTGCVDLTFSAATVDESPITVTNYPGGFAAGYVTNDYMERAEAISDYMQREAFLSKFLMAQEGLITSPDASFERSFDRETSSTNYSAGIPAWFLSLDQPTVGTIVAPGDTSDLIITVNQPVISRGPQVVYIAWDSNDPDYFLNSSFTDGAGKLPEIKLTIVGGCLIDTTTLSFGMGAANTQLVTNTARLGTGDWSPHGFDIDGDASSYYQGAYLYGVSKYEIATNSQDWLSGGSFDGEAGSWFGLQADPNWCDNSCKPALTSNYPVGSITADGLTYSPITADMVCKTYIDSVTSAGRVPDELVLGSFGWSDFANLNFDDTLTMGLMVHTRTVGTIDLPELANLTLEIMEFNERNSVDSVTDWYFGQMTDYDVGGDAAAVDFANSIAWAYNPGGGNAWGSIKIPFGCGTLGAGQDFTYDGLLNIKDLGGAEAFFSQPGNSYDNGAAYWDSAYTWLSQGAGVIGDPQATSDFEMHTTYAGHDFEPGGTFSMGVANFAMFDLADNTSSTEMVGMAQLVNKWAGFGRGDVNNDGGINLADIIYLAATINGGPGAIPFAHLSDVNADGLVDAGDINYLVDYYFNCGPCPMGDWMF